jgi:hypothetical protein
VVTLRQLAVVLAPWLTCCGGFDAGPLACQFKGEYLITAHSLQPEECESWTQRREFAGSFALSCSPELALGGYSGTVACIDDGDNVAFACTGQLHGEGCSWELVVERVTP